MSFTIDRKGTARVEVSLGQNAKEPLLLEKAKITWLNKNNSSYVTAKWVDDLEHYGIPTGFYGINLFVSTDK
ncbi:hypothetical protein D3C71_1702760 [compost metagenome]